MGICALCGVTAELRDSHYLPAAFYRRLHSNGLPPVVIDPERAMYQAKQMKAKLLCDACEHRFKIQGEDWVVKCTCKPTGGFPLRDLLLQTPPVGQMRPPRVAFWYYGDRLPELRHAEIIYFAASVFWRGWVFDWSQLSSRVAHLELPEGLGAEFRDFLLGKAAFPSSVILQVEIAFNPLFAGGRLGMTFPGKITPRNPNVGPEAVGYFFVVFGVTLSLYFDLGKGAGLTHGKVTSFAEPPHPILLTDVRISEVEACRQKFESTAKRVGRLAR